MERPKGVDTARTAMRALEGVAAPPASLTLYDGGFSFYYTSSKEEEPLTSIFNMRLSIISGLDYSGLD